MTEVYRLFAMGDVDEQIDRLVDEFGDLIDRRLGGITVSGRSGVIVTTEPVHDRPVEMYEGALLLLYRGPFEAVAEWTDDEEVTIDPGLEIGVRLVEE